MIRNRTIQPDKPLMNTVLQSLAKLLVVVVCLCFGSASAFAQSDDFNDGNDTGWTRFGLDAVGLPKADITFPADGNGGKAYRLHVLAPSTTAFGPGRVFAYRKDVTYAHLLAPVDLITFDNSINQAFGF